MKTGHIFFISGVAGAGKGTVIKKILEKNLPNFELALSCKTREFRAGEIQGRDYNKLTKQEFIDSINSGEFLEFNFVHNQDYYGTRYKEVVEDGIEQGKIILKEMDILSLPKLIQSHPHMRGNYTYIFLDLPHEKMKERMSIRGDKVEGKDFDNRMISARKESALKNLADFVINADQTPEQVFEDVYNIISKKL